MAEPKFIRSVQERGPRSDVSIRLSRMLPSVDATMDRGGLASKEEG